MDDFTAASRRALHYLSQTFDFALWMVTRLENDDWVVLTAEDLYYGIGPGTVFKSQDSICSRMLEGLGPQFAPDISLVPAYAQSPVVRQYRIGSYFSLPIHHADGRLFGTLCAADPEPRPRSVLEKLETLRLIAEMLSHILAIEMRCVVTERECERIATEANRDALTGLYNRRGWMQFVEKEELRCRRYGHSLGHAGGDDLLQRAGRAIAGAVRDSDIVARIGGDEFSVLCLEITPGDAEGLETRLRAALAGGGVAASLGRALRSPVEGLPAACAEADRAMYAEKAVRRAERAAAA
jgi:GGDEF domain-containing protein